MSSYQKTLDKNEFCVIITNKFLLLTLKKFIIMNEDRFSPSNELLDRQDIDLLWTTFESGKNIDDCISRYFFEICQANDLIEKYLDFYSKKSEYPLRLRFWKVMSVRIYNLRRTSLVEKFQQEYADKNNYRVRAIMDKLCNSLDLRYELPKDFFYLLNRQENNFISEIKVYLRMIKDKKTPADTIDKVVPQMHRDFMFRYNFYKEQNGEYRLTEQGVKALCAPYANEATEQYNLVAFMEALNAPTRSSKIVI